MMSGSRDITKTIGAHKHGGRHSQAPADLGLTMAAGNSLKTRRNSTIVRRSPGKLNDAQMYAFLIMP